MHMCICCNIARQILDCWLAYANVSMTKQDGWQHSYYYNLILNRVLYLSVFKMSGKMSVSSSVSSTP
jgi:hypothetical protein